jgi:hypothetical protein
MTETIGEATQTIEYKTQGWGVVFGGGAEVWVAGAFALYGEAQFAGLKGAPEGGGDEVRLDDRLRLFTFGARVRIGR